MSLFASQVQAGQSRKQKLDDIKVAYLVNFLRLTIWPDLNQDDPDKPLNITVISDKNFYELLASAFPKSTFQDRKVNITHWTRLEVEEGKVSDEVANTLKQSHLIYLSRGRIADLQLIKRTTAKPGYLLIGDMPKFAEYGGMIGLIRRQSGIAFTVNIDAIRKADLFISSKVLRLGIPVDEVEAP